MKRFLFVALLLTAGCSPGLHVDTYPTKPGSDIDCKALYADAPARVAGQDDILVEDDNALAWGAPPIILRCGVERPDDLRADSECFTVDDLCWFAERTADGYLFTLTRHAFFVSVEVPGDYQPEADALGDLTRTVHKHVPELS